MYGECCVWWVGVLLGDVCCVVVWCGVVWFDVMMLRDVSAFHGVVVFLG